jgi:hypothetical protein
MRDFAGAIIWADHRLQGTPARRRRSRAWRWGIGLVGGAAVLAASAVPAGAARNPMAAATTRSYLGRLTNQAEVGSTVPVKGDVNPYGVAVVGQSTGRLVAGDVLVSNFNAKSNFQGTGSTIVEIAPNGQQTLFAHLGRGELGGRCPGGVGLTTALGILDDGFVVVGSLPTHAGVLRQGDSGCLVVLSPNGTPSFTVSGGLVNGPWDLTVVRDGPQDQLFVTNVLNGTVAAGGATVAGGTVVRLTVDVRSAFPSITESVVVGSGFPERTDPAALVVGPTGVAVDRSGTLYVADSAGNDIRAIPDAVGRTTSAGTGTQVSAGGDLNDPLGMALAPNGDILTANGDNGNIVETTPAGMQLTQKLVDSNPMPGPQPGNGSLFGLAQARGTGLYFVDDDNNDLNLLSR